MPEISTDIGLNRYRQLVKAIHKLTLLDGNHEILEYVAHASAVLCNAEIAWILIHDHSSKSLRCETGFFSATINFRELFVPIESSLEGYVYQAQKSITINNPGTYDKKQGKLIQLPRKKINSIIVLPAVSKGKTSFILEVANKCEGEFTEIDREILEAFLQQAAVCHEKSQHFLQSDLIPELVHELRTPLAALNTAIHLLQRPDLPAEKRKQISEIIQIEFSRLTDLTTSFLDYARLKSGKEKFVSTDFDLNRLVLEAVEIIKMQFDGRDTTIANNLPSQAIYINADRNKIKQVILNLLNNAVKYNRPGGMINITATSNHNYVVITVQDTGIGIPPEFIPQLFERFYRIPNTERQIKGTGLGLTICKQIIEAHNGQIDVSSKVGEGSTFTVRLPLQAGI